jgi:signal peptidase I
MNRKRFMAKLFDSIKAFRAKHPEIYGLISDVVFSVAIVAVIAVALYAYAGMWPPMVSVNGISMLPHMESGDLVFIQGLDRGAIQTSENSTNTSYMMYEGYGDVIVYRPYGDPTKPLVIHRAIRYVTKGEPMWDGGPTASDDGYITLGDNNHGVYDQEAPSICYLEPVRKEWILGIARFKVPYLGYLRSLV